MVEAYCDLDVAVAAPGCDLLVIGNNHDRPRIGDLTAAIGKDLTVQPFDAFNLEPVDGTLERIGRLLADGVLSIEIAERYDLEAAAEAQRAVVEDSFVGKLVVRP
jgi:NADPH:quinone reductase-like Zn-dependent oxidoreductase